MSAAYVLLALCWGISAVNLALALRLAIPHHSTTGPTRSPLRRSRPSNSGRDVSGARPSRAPIPGEVSAGESLASPGTTRPLAARSE